MNIKSFLILYCAFCCMSVAAQTTYHVNAVNGDDANDGRLWSKAFATLQTALDKAQSNDTIFVAAGTYYPTQPVGKMNFDLSKVKMTGRNRSFVLRAGVCLYGGFPADANDNTGMKDRDWETHATILSGDFDNNDKDDFSQMDENAYHVLIVFSANDLTIVDGFTVTGGNANGTKNGMKVDNVFVSNECGGGIYSYDFERGNELSPKLSHLIVKNNAAVKNGGGIFNYSENGEANPNISYSTILHNRAGENGGGIYNNAKRVASPELLNVTIRGNQAGLQGGGVFCLSEKLVSAPHLTNTLICGNVAHVGGGMICCSYAGNVAPILINVTVSGNKAIGEGGGFACSAGKNGKKTGISSPKFYNTIIWGNKASQGYPNLYNNGAINSNPNMHNSYIEGEPRFFTGVKISDAININPEFAAPIDASSAPTIEGDYRLNGNSPFIDRGDDLYVHFIKTDLAGEKRVYGEHVDLGAYEYQGVNLANVDEANSGNRIWASDGQVTVLINEPTTIRIYTVEGKLFRQYNDEKQGTKIITLPNGIYFISLNDKDKVKVIVY